MAQDDNNAMANGAADPAAMGDAAPQVSVLAQYVKDLSVENPNAPAVFQWTEQAALDVQFNIQVENVADDVHEVTLKIDVTAKSEKGTHFVLDLAYAGLFGIRGLPDEAMGPMLLVEAPRLIFPFARQVIADSVSAGGFPPLLLDPIDFGAAYMAQMQAAQAQGEGAAAPAPADTPTDG